MRGEFDKHELANIAAEYADYLRIKLCELSGKQKWHKTRMQDIADILAIITHKLEALGIANEPTEQMEDIDLDIDVVKPVHVCQHDPAYAVS